MESTFLSNIKKLYTNELDSSVIPITSLLSTLLQNDHSVATPDLEYQVLLFSSNVNYQERNFRMASKQYESVLLLRKSMERSQNSNLLNKDRASEHFSELETRYRLAKCYHERAVDHKAVSTLQAVPLKKRTAKVNMLLAELFHFSKAANTAAAATSYKEVLKECAMALSALESLLTLGVNGIEVNSLVVNASTVPNHLEWLSKWIKGHAQMRASIWKLLKVFKISMEQSSISIVKPRNCVLPRHNVRLPYLISLMGKCFYYHGRSQEAQEHLETVLTVYPYDVNAQMPLAVVYDYNKKLQELEKLSAQMTNFSEFKSERWFVLAESSYVAGQIDKATSFAKKAISLNNRNVEALLLRGCICIKLQQFVEAITFFRTIQCIASYRFEVYKGLFHCYVGLKRREEAQMICGFAVRNFRSSRRSYAMYAMLLLHSLNPLAKKSAKRFLIKALELDEHYAPAVVLMVVVCQSNGDIQEASVVLKKQVKLFPNHTYFSMLDDLRRIVRDLHAALKYYTTALRLDPNDRRALRGINELTSCSNIQDQETFMPLSRLCEEEWQIDDEMEELSSYQDDYSDTYSDPFWIDIESEVIN